MIEVKQLIILLVYILGFCISGNFMKQNYRFFNKIKVNCEEREILAINVIIYFVLCINILAKAVKLVMGL